MVTKTGEISKKVIESCLLPGQKVDFTKIKQRVRKDLGDYFYKETGSIPMVITVILEI
jgi:mRNA degradation ribonuclease J1/J2